MTPMTKIPPAIDELYEILRPLRIWLFSNKVRRAPDGYWHITLPREAVVPLQGLEAAHGFKIHYEGLN